MKKTSEKTNRAMMFLQRLNVSSVTYPEIWRSPYGDAASPVGDAASLLEDAASPSGDLQISGYVTLLHILNIT